MSSKLMRSELKTIVKECLVEILSEGLLHQEEKLVESKPKKRKPKKKRHGYLDKINFNNKKINTNITNDPILNEVLKLWSFGKFRKILSLLRLFTELFWQYFAKKRGLTHFLQ